MITYKIKHKHYISNLYLPERKSGKVAVLLPGLPPSTNIDKLVCTLLEAGVIVYYPSFSGFGDSGGVFGASNCIKDIGEFYTMAKKSKVKELYFGKQLDVGEIKEVVLIGMSFSAAIALQGHMDKFDKIVLLSSAIIYNQRDFPTKALGIAFSDQMKHLLSLLKNTMPYTCRIGKDSDLKDFLLGKLVQARRKSVVSVLNYVSRPMLILHGTKDTSIPAEIIKSIQRDTANENISWQFIDSAHSLSSYGEEAMKTIADFIVS